MTQDKVISCFRINAYVVAGGIIGALISATARRLTGTGTVLSGAVEGFAARSSAALSNGYLEKNHFDGIVVLIASAYVGCEVADSLRDIRK